MNALIIVAVAFFCNAGGDCVQLGARVPDLISCAALLNSNPTIQSTEDVTFYQVQSECAVIQE